MIFHFKRLRHNDLGQIKYHLLLNLSPNPKFSCAHSFLGARAHLLILCLALWIRSSKPPPDALMCAYCLWHTMALSECWVSDKLLKIFSPSPILCVSPIGSLRGVQCRKSLLFSIPQSTSHTSFWSTCLSGHFLSSASLAASSTLAPSPGVSAVLNDTLPSGPVPTNVCWWSVLSNAPAIRWRTWGTSPGRSSGQRRRKAE